MVYLYGLCLPNDSPMSHMLIIYNDTNLTDLNLLHKSRVMPIFLKWYSYITTVHTEHVMTRLYIVYHLGVTRCDAFIVNGPL
jgi:hypothetical protein